MAKTVSDVIVETLLDWGVDTVFGLPGDGINGFVEALRKARDKIRYIHMRHEEAAAMAACGYASSPANLAYVFRRPRPALCTCSMGYTTPRSTARPCWRSRG